VRSFHKKATGWCGDSTTRKGSDTCYVPKGLSATVPAESKHRTKTEMIQTKTKNNADSDNTCQSIVCFASVDWWYHPRGHFDCQIMTRLVRRVPVLWVNPIGMRLPHPGKSRLSLQRYVRKTASLVRGLQQDGSGMWIYSPVFIPCYRRRCLQINGWLLARQVSVLRHLLGLDRAAVWATLPTVAPAVVRSQWQHVFVNRCDDFAAFEEADGDTIREMEELLLQCADRSFYVNRQLLEEERLSTRRAIYLGNGVDLQHFAPQEDCTAARVHQLKHLRRPVVGFYGQLQDYTVDSELLCRVARHIAPATLLLIGLQAMDLSALLKHSNVFYLGPIPYRDLPSYARCFDVALLPWRRNRWIQHCNPLKLKEYLALGLPVVSVRFPELAPFEPLVYPADSREEFLSALDAALAERDTQAAVRRRRAVGDSDWEQLANRVASIMGIPCSRPHQLVGAAIPGGRPN